MEGAVADADAIEEYLKENMGVLPSHICKLVDKDATRAQILEKFQALEDDPRIKKGNPILIYYAGHGNTAKAPKNWTTEDGNIQSILPVDYYMPEPQSVKIPAGSDGTIGVL